MGALKGAWNIASVKCPHGEETSSLAGGFLDRHKLWVSDTAFVCQVGKDGTQPRRPALFGAFRKPTLRHLGRTWAEMHSSALPHGPKEEKYSRVPWMFFGQTWTPLCPRHYSRKWQQRGKESQENHGYKGRKTIHKNNLSTRKKDVNY